MDFERLALLRSIREASIDLSLADVNLLLRELGREPIESGWWESGYNNEVGPDDRREMISRRLEDLSQQQLAEWGFALRTVFGTKEPISNIDQPRPLQLFASHLHAQAVLVKEVSDALRDYGVKLFVAHVDIEPGMAWHETIELNLSTADGGVAFLRPEFIESKWCDQEVGWLLGRGVPVLGVKFGQDPYGPLGKVQAISGVGPTSTVLADSIVSWARAQPVLARNLVSSAAIATLQSTSAAQTQRLWAILRDAKDLNTSEVAAVVTAVRDNYQVYGVQKESDEPQAEYLPRQLLSLAVAQPGYAENRQLIADVASNRGLNDILPKPQPSTDVWNTPGNYAADTPF